MATRVTTLWVLATVKTHLGVTTTDKDTDIEKCADLVTEFIERVHQRQYVNRDRTEVRDGDGRRTLLLDHLPVNSVTSVTIKRSPYDTAETIAAADRDTDTERGIIRLRDTTYTVGFQNVTVVYNHGRGAQDAATLPADVYWGGLDMVKFVLDQKWNGAVWASSINVGGASVMLKVDWPLPIKELLALGRPRV